MEQTVCHGEGALSFHRDTIIPGESKIVGLINKEEHC